MDVHMFFCIFRFKCITTRRRISLRELLFTMPIVKLAQAPCLVFQPIGSRRLASLLVLCAKSSTRPPLAILKLQCLQWSTVMMIDTLRQDMVMASLESTTWLRASFHTPCSTSRVMTPLCQSLHWLGDLSHLKWRLKMCWSRPRLMDRSSIGMQLLENASIKPVKTLIIISTA